MPKLTILKYDLTKLEVDVIVNAANKTLLGGGGVDGAIHVAAGAELLEECKEIRKNIFPEGLPTGEVVMTKGYNLPTKWVFHTVGPIFGKEDITLLEKCYSNCLKLAEEQGFETIAFPAISTGFYGLPIEFSAQMVKRVLDKFQFVSIKEIKLILYKDYDLGVYESVFS